MSANRQAKADEASGLVVVVMVVSLFIFAAFIGQTLGMLAGYLVWGSLCAVGMP